MEAAVLSRLSEVLARAQAFSSRTLGVSTALAILISMAVPVHVFGACPDFSVAHLYGAGATPSFIAVGDFNGDGRSDVAVANQGSNNVSILLGNGDGTFAAAVNYGVGAAPRSVGLGDFNGDGKID